MRHTKDARAELFFAKKRAGFFDENKVCGYCGVVTSYPLRAALDCGNVRAALDSRESD